MPSPLASRPPCGADRQLDEPSQGGVGGVAEAGHHLVVDLDGLPGAVELAEVEPLVD